MPGVNAYRSWYSSANQVSNGVDTVTPLKITNEFPNTGAGTITISNQSTNATFTVSNNGTYEITLNVTATNSGADAFVNVWALSSGTAIVGSNVKGTVANNHTLSISNTFTVNLLTTTPLTFAWLTDGASLQLTSSAAVSGKQPLTPSFIVSIKQLNSTFRPDNVWYVSKDNPNNRWMDGSYESPFNTIQAAINAANLIGASAGTQVINIAPGTYSEALTITKGYVSFVGTANSQFTNSGVTIAAPVGTSHVINITNSAYNSLYQNQVTFANLTLASAGASAASVAVLVNTSSQQHTVLFNRCQLYGKNVLYNNAAVAADKRTYIEDCEWISTGVGVVSPGSTDACFRHTCGAAVIVRGNFSTGANIPCIHTLNTGVVWLASLCNFASGTTEAAAAPIVRLSAEVTYPQSFGQCAFTYSSATPKTSPDSCGILLAGGVSQQLVLTDTAFTLLGTSAEGFAVHVSGVGVHQVWQSGSYAFNVVSGVVSAPTAHYINAPIVQQVDLAPFLLGE